MNGIGQLRALMSSHDRTYLELHNFYITAAYVDGHVRVDR
jgi:prepilin-type processing-associated H-X9-DG protein